MADNVTRKTRAYVCLAHLSYERFLASLLRGSDPMPMGLAR